MKIEDVDELDKQWREGDFGAADRAIAALRAEAWHPIEKAEELGAHSGEIAVLGYGDWGGQNEWFPMIWEGKFWTSSGDFVNPTHFRFINPTGGSMKVWYEVEFVSKDGGSVTVMKRFATYLDAKRYCNEDEGYSRIVKVTETREVVE